jgi:hypothetical protein
MRVGHYRVVNLGHDQGAAVGRARIRFGAAGRKANSSRTMTSRDEPGAGQDLSRLSSGRSLAGWLRRVGIGPRGGRFCRNPPASDNYTGCSRICLIAPPSVLIIAGQQGEAGVAGEWPYRGEMLVIQRQDLGCLVPGRLHHD